MNQQPLAAFPMDESEARRRGLLRDAAPSKLTPEDHAANVSAAQAKRARKALKLARHG